MRRISQIVALVAIAAMLVVLAPTASAGPASTHGPPDNPGQGKDNGAQADMVRVIVTHKARSGQARAAMQAHGEVLAELKLQPTVLMEVPRQALRGLVNSPHVVSVVEDVARPPALGSTLGVINADDVHNLAWTGAGTTVAVLDTGIDSDHPFFGGRVVAERCYSTISDPSEVSLCSNGNSADVDSEPNCFDGIGDNICDHGVHVAGISSGSTDDDPGAPGSGVAPDSQIIAFQVFHRNNDAGACAPASAPCVLSYDFDRASALEELLILHNANPAWGVVAANISIGGGEFDTPCDGATEAGPIEDLLAAGVATTISAGNDGFLDAVGLPACISAAVTVGNTLDNDDIRASSNRGVLLDLFAPGTNVDSAIDAGNYGSKTGTSMAAPHVAGALAVLRSAYPGRSVADLINDLEVTGVPINYTSDGSPVTTPRINLLAALQEPNDPPVVSVDQGLVEVDEGQIATNGGTATDSDGMGEIVSIEASVGTATLDGLGGWDWDWQTLDGPVESQTVTVTVTDDKGESTPVEFELVVNNVDPTMSIDPASTTDIDEGEFASVIASYTDPGSLDTHTVDWDWGVGAYPGLEGPTALIVNANVAPEPSSGTAVADYRYGDNGTFTVTSTVTDKDGGEGSATVDVNVANVAPSALIDLTGSQMWNGMPIFFGSTDDPIELSGDVTDPGSDDVSLDWNFGDGESASRVDLVNPPDADPLPSPTVAPRDVNDMVEHLYEMACAYTVDFSSTDDDGGLSPLSAAQVIVVGVEDEVEGHGYWQHQYRGNGRIDFDTDELDCLLSIVNVVSSVFDEERDLGSIADAVDVLWLKGNGGDASEIFDAHLLTLWLNFANGSVGLDEMVDVDGDGIADMTAGELLIAAEAVRTNPASSDADLLDYKDMIETVNESS